MQITVLGKSCAWPDAGGACSGYLLTHGDLRVLLDCGTGVLAKLRTLCSYAEIDAIVISHLHADHFLDLIPYSYALRYSTAAPCPRPRLLGPPGARSLFAGLGAAAGFDDQIERSFAVEEYDPADTLTLGDLRLSFREVPHFIRAFACELSDRRGGRFTYGADCRYSDELAQFARETDLLLVEAADGPAPAPGEPVERQGHMTARQAGELGRAARARRLLVSHFSDELDAARLRAEATAGFGADVELASEGAQFTV